MENAVRTLIVITGFSLGVGSTASAQNFVCDEDVPTLTYGAEVQERVDELWDQTLTYLEGIVETLSSPAGCLDSARAITQTHTRSSRHAETRCITRYRDVELMLKHLNAVLAHPDEAKKCFSPQKDYDGFPLYTPNEEMKAASPVAEWIDRPTLSDFYAASDGELGKAGRELASQFSEILEQTSSPEAASEKLAPDSLPDLWGAVGWLPFYADNPKAHNDRFRGGYAYAEVMGPWGLLRIKEIDGELVGAEIGMTIQLANSYYPYHYHHPQEIYITLSESSCKANEFMVAHWDNPLFSQERTDTGWRVAIELTRRQLRKLFKPQNPDGNWLTYFERNAIHSFSVGESCGGEEAAGGLVTVWARTTSRDNTQTTRVCTVDDEEKVGRTVTPADRFICELNDWQP